MFKVDWLIRDYGSANLQKHRPGFGARFERELARGGRAGEGEKNPGQAIVAEKERRHGSQKT